MYVQKADFSNYGECVDVWAPGKAITSAIADCDSCYDTWDGTSMASPHTTGFIANLLWLDPTLTYHEIKYLLRENTTTITKYQCDTFNCLYAFYQCDVIPSEWYGVNNTIAPATTESQAEQGPITVSGVFDFLPNYDCNVVVALVIDPTQEDETMYNNYSISSIQYEITDKCLTWRINATIPISFSYDCVDEKIAQFTIWTTENCEGEGDSITTIYDGMFDDDYWWHVDCSNTYDIENEVIDSFDGSDCDLVFRYSFTDNYNFVNGGSLGGYYDCENTDDTYTQFYDISAAVGACESFTNGTYEWSRKYFCDESQYSLIEYASSDCTGNTTSNRTYPNGCYSDGAGGSVFVETIECGNAVTEETTPPNSFPVIIVVIVVLGVIIIIALGIFVGIKRCKQSSVTTEHDFAGVISIPTENTKKFIDPMDNDEKLLKLVLEWFKDKHEEEKLAILLTTGSLNPIHTGHIDMMNFAKTELESMGKYRVIGGFMSPSHDGYVSSKASYIRSDDRIKMIKLAVKDSTWIECDEWECNQDHFVDYPQVCQEFTRKINSGEFLEKIGKYINSKMDGNELKRNENDLSIDVDEMRSAISKMSIFYVCGRDHCDKCGLWNGVYGYDGVVAKTLVVPRPDSKNNNRQNSKNCIVVNVPQSKMTDDRSSTQIRKYIQKSNGESKKFGDIKAEIKKTNMLHENVLEYIENNLDDLYKQLTNKYYKPRS